MPPPQIASAVAMSISTRHGTTADAAASRCGNAEPTVSAPMRIPSAAPRRCSNQPAATFMPGGYTHASAAPVTPRSTISGTTPVETTSPAFARPPAMQPRLKRRRALITSGRFNSADSNVPTTKPPCTAIVNHAVSPGVSSSSLTICSFAAVAENHSVMPSNIASESQASWLRADTTWSVADPFEVPVCGALTDNRSLFAAVPKGAHMADQKLTGQNYTTPDLIA